MRRAPVRRLNGTEGAPLLLINCPHCGPRSEPEFIYGRVTEAVTDPSVEAAAAFASVYLRDNPRGPSRELWRHAAGCGAWLILDRDTASHTISAVVAATGLSR